LILDSVRAIIITSRDIDEMYNIIFYSTADGTSELRDFLINLRKKSLTNKDARIQHKQIAQYIEEDIWELRPGNNRVLFFYHKDDTYVLLHLFRKRTQKTPRSEIEKAKRERNDWLTREG